MSPAVYHRLIWRIANDPDTSDLSTAVLVIAAIIEQNDRLRPNARCDNVRPGMHRFSHGKCRHLVCSSIHEYLCRENKKQYISSRNWHYSAVIDPFDLPGLNKMIAFRHVSSARSMLKRFIFTLSSDRIRSNIGATPAWWALLRCNVKLCPKHMSCGSRTGARRSIVPSAFVRSVSRYYQIQYIIITDNQYKCFLCINIALTFTYFYTAPCHCCYQQFIPSCSQQCHLILSLQLGEVRHSSGIFNQLIQLFVYHLT